MPNCTIKTNHFQLSQNLNVTTRFAPIVFMLKFAWTRISTEAWNCRWQTFSTGKYVQAPKRSPFARSFPWIRDCVPQDACACEIKISGVCFYFLKQCADVRTQQVLIRVAPHTSLPSPRDPRKRIAACHGQPLLRHKCKCTQENRVNFVNWVKLVMNKLITG